MWTSDLLVLVASMLLLVGSCSGQSHSPPASNYCPAVFQYNYDNGQWKGLISVQPPLQFSRVSIRVNMTTDFFPQYNGIGGISVRGGSAEIQEISNRVTFSEAQVIHFLVTFPSNQPIPKMISININGQEFCSGQIPNYRYKGLINLEYMITTGVPNAPHVSGNQFIPAANQGSGGNFIAQKPDDVQPAYQPVPQRPVYQEPVTQRPVYQEPFTQRPVYQEPVTQRPVYVQPVQQQPAYVQPTQEPSRRPAPTDPSDNAPVDTGSASRSCKTGPEETVLCIKRCEQLDENQKSPIQRRNSLKLIFRPGKPLPPSKDIHDWVNDALAIPEREVEAIQLVDDKATVIIKFKKATTGQSIVSVEGGFKEYQHKDGSVEQVELVVVGVGQRRVEVFDLPVELPNEAIAKFLRQYGAVQNITDLYWDESYRYRVKNGVRLVDINVKHQINKVIEIEGYKGLVQYDGQPTPCNCNGTIQFLCDGKPVTKDNNLSLN